MKFFVDIIFFFIEMNNYTYTTTFGKTAPQKNRFLDNVPAGLV